MHTHTQTLDPQVEELKKNAGKGEHAAMLAALKQAEAAKSADSQRAKRMSALGTKKPETCMQCTELQDRVTRLDEELKRTREALTAVEKRPDTSKIKELVKSAESAGENKLRDAQTLIETLTASESALRAENARLKRRLADGAREDASMISESTVRDVDMSLLAEHAANMDAHAHSIDARDGTRIADAEGSQELSALDDSMVVDGTLAHVLKEFGLSETNLMDIMEKVEGLQGGAQG